MGQRKGYKSIITSDKNFDQSHFLFLTRQKLYFPFSMEKFEDFEKKRICMSEAQLFRSTLSILAATYQTTIVIDS